jgi:3D (Asp-Asp-Asp) domain-containing protein
MKGLAASYGRQVLVTALVAVVFVFFYQTTARDSRYAARDATVKETTSLPQPGARMLFTATAYCKGETTASGVLVRTGIAAADPALLPVGTVVRVDTPNPRYSGIWTVMDTGPAVQGRVVDLYLRSCNEALAFGRRSVRLTVLRLGWSPENSVPGMVDAMFRKREAESKRPPGEPPVPAASPAPAAGERQPLPDPKPH